MPTMGRATAVGTDEALGWRRRLPASAKPCRKRAWSDPMLPRQGSIHDPVYRSNTTTCRNLSWSVDALRIEPYGFEVAFYARCCMQSSENSPSTHSGEQGCWRLVLGLRLRPTISQGRVHL